MRKLTVLVSLFLALASALFADEYVISTIECVDSQNYYDRELKFKYDDKDNVFYLCRSTYTQAYWYIFKPEQLNKLRAALKKAKDWEAIVKDKKATVSKVIPDSSLSVSGAMKSNYDWYITRRNLNLSCAYVGTINESGELLSGFMITGDSKESYQNEFIDIEFEGVLFLNDYIDRFIEAISEETVAKAIAEHEEKAAQADLFN